MTGNSKATLPCNRSADAMLPNPRRVSKEMHREESHPESRVRIQGTSVLHYLILPPNFQNTLMLVLMGQFLDHDMTLAPESHVELERCCETEQDRLSEELQETCFAVRIPDADTAFQDRSGNRQAISFT